MNKKCLISVVAASGCLSSVVLAEDWNKSLDFGLSLSKGNTDSSLTRAAVKAEKKLVEESYSGELSYSYGEENGEANQDELLAKASYKNIFAGKNFYGLRFDARRDQFADIDYRFSLNATYGYYWIDSDVTTFSTELGLGLTVEDKGDGRDAYLNGLFDQYYSHELNDFTKVFQSFSFSPRIGNISDYRLEFKAGLETQVTETVSFKISFEDRYESQPAAGKKSNDLKVLAGLSYKF